MRHKNNIRRSPLKPGRYGLGLGLALWLITANGFNQNKDPSPDVATRIDTLVTIDTNFLYDQTDELANQRKDYRQAEIALKKGHMQTFNRLLQKLGNYPLYPYLEYQQISRRLNQLDQNQVDQFFERNDGSIIADKLRRKLINYYARHNRWDDLIHIYQAQSSVHLQCKYLQALIQTDQSEHAYEMVRKLWLTGKSQPKACDPVFDAWEATGQRTHELTWQRIKLAMASGHYRLAVHLSKSLPAADHKLVLYWKKIHRKPELALSDYIRELQHEAKNDILIHAIMRMSRKDTDKAIDLWQKLSDTHHFTQQEEYAAYRHIGLRLARNHHPEASQWLNRIPLQFADITVLEWDIRTAIRIGDWQKTLTAIENMPVQKQSELRWQFWWAYAHEQLGNINDAEGIYHYLAGRRSYYGFLAADRLKLPYDFENRPLNIDTADLVSISQYPETARAHELYKLNKISSSRREWRRLIESLSDHQILAASKLAQHWGWHDRAIITMGKTDYRDDIQLRFPLALKEKIEEWSTKRSIETAWTYAIIRRESAFMHDAKSPVGALGLM
ncbi:MAG: transglycosylase SLT domain-containing protein, partial [Gammaproteobacteria bacterium]|nr:transglycosylase SLT domain-containing protein [Gammaproteobacteria bacterium]